MTEQKYKTYGDIKKQFTGRYDKNGTEIYDYDILRDENGVIHKLQLEPFIRTPDDTQARWDEVIWFQDTDSTCCEVIGNIIDNPEL